MSSHTPGPWYVVGDSWGTGVDVVAGSPDPHLGPYVATTDTLLVDEDDFFARTDEQRRADAELVAAAPELLKQLRKITAAARAYHDDTGHEQPSPIVRCDLICDAMREAEALLGRLG